MVFDFFSLRNFQVWQEDALLSKDLPFLSLLSNANSSMVDNEVMQISIPRAELECMIYSVYEIMKSTVNKSIHSWASGRGRVLRGS